MNEEKEQDPEKALLQRYFDYRSRGARWVFLAMAVLTIVCVLYARLS